MKINIKKTSFIIKKIFNHHNCTNCIIILAFLLRQFQLRLFSFIVIFLTQLFNNNQFISETLIFFNLNNLNYSNNIILLCSFFLFTYLLKVLILLSYIHISQSLYKLSSNLSKRLYIKYLRNNFSFHINNNSSILIKILLLNKYFTSMINQFFVILTDTLILLSILFVILYYSPFIGLISFITIALFGGLFFYLIF